MIRSAIQPVKKESSHQHFAAQIQRKYVRAGVLGWNPISLVFRANTGIMRQEDAAPRPIVINFQWHLARLREQKNTIQVLQEKLYYLLDRADKEKPGQGEQEIPPAFQHYYNWEHHPDTRQSLKPHIASIYREKILERLLWETIREISSSKLLDKPVNNHPTPFKERTGRIAGRLPGNPSYRYMGSQNDVRTDGQTEAFNYQRLSPAIYFNPPYNGAGERKAASGRENHIIGYLYQQAALAGEIDAVRDIDVNHPGKKRLLQALKKIEQSNLIASEAEKNEHSGRAEQKIKKIKRLLKQLLLWQAIRINKPQNWMRSSGEHSRTRNYPGQVGRKTIGRWQKLLSSINMQINAPELLPRGRAVSVEPIKRNYPAKIPIFSKAGFPEVQVAQSEAARRDMLAVMVYLKPRSFKQYMMERRWPRAMARFEEEPVSPGGSAYRAKLLDHWFRQNISEARKRISPDRIDKNNLGQLNDRAIMSRRRIPGESSYRYQGEPSAVWPVGTEAVNYPNWKPDTHLLPALSKVERGKRTPGNENQENQIIKYLDHQASYTGQTKDENSKNLDYLDRNGLLPQLIKIEPSKALRFEIKEKERPGKIPGANIENLMQQLLIWQVIRAQEPQGLTGSSRESSRTAHYPVQKQQNITERWLTLMLATKNRGNHAAISNQARIPIVNQYQENDLASEPGILDRSNTNVEKTGPAIPRRIMLAMLVYLKPGWFRQSVMEKHQPRTAAATPEPPGMSKGDYREKILERRLDAGEASGFIRLPRVEPYSLRQLSNRMGSIAKPWPNQPRYWHNSNRREISARAEGGTAVNLLYPNIYLTLPSRRPGGGKTGLKSQGEIIRYLDNTAALKPQSRKSEHELRRYTDIVSLQSRFGKMEQLQDESRDYQARLPFGTKYEPKLEQLRQELQLWQLIKAQEAGPGPDSSQASARIYHLPGPYVEPTIERWQTLIKEIRREGQAALLPGREKSRSFPAVKKYWQGR
ncbi:MAG: hypothetical protein PHX14_10850, partial [Syntrophomonadaceae bacterium]|nr:hypothetical protein [Syntrophomonadaceae bacterium]